MFDDEEEDHYEHHLEGDLAQFEAHLKGKSLGFIDSDRLEAIIDHYLMNSQFAKAQKAAEIGDANFSFNPTFKLRIAQSLSGMGNLKDALNIMRRLETTSLPKFEVYVTRAAIYSQLKDHNNAIQNLSMALSLADQEDRNEIYLDISAEYHLLRDFKSSIAILKKALKDNPNNEMALYELGFTYDRMGDFHAAIDAYRSYLDESPYSNLAWYNLGNAYSKIENFEKAVWAYDYSILVFDEFAPAHFNMGNAFLTLGKYHQAIERFKVAMELDGDDAMALCYLGEAHEQLQEYDLAKNYYHLSLELEPELPEAWLGLGIISDIEGKTKEGIVLLKKALSFDLNSASIHLVLANAYHKSNERELAETHFLKSLSLDALDSESLSDYVFFVMEESVQDALKYLEENQHEMEQNSVFLQMLVHVLVTLKKFKEAALIFSSIVATNIEQAKELLEWNPKLLNRKEFVNLMNE